MSFIIQIDFTAKFVLSRCAFCKRTREFGFFCSVNHFGEGGVNANQKVTCSPSLAKIDSRLLKNSERKEVAMVSGFYVEGRRQALLYSCN